MATAKDCGKVLASFRSLLKGQKLAAFIVGSEDAHQSEYVRSCDMRRAWISGFTGSAGTAVITLDEAKLWTDGRYWLQAEEELSSDWNMMKDRLPSTPSVSEWLASSLSEGDRVGVDPWLVSSVGKDRYLEALTSKGVEFVPVEQNLVDVLWEAEGKSAPIKRPISLHPEQYAGESHHEKLAKLREAMEKKDVDHLLVSALDEVAWLFNIRGSDIMFNPVVMSYAVIGREEATLFVDLSQVTEEVRSHLGGSVKVEEYTAVASCMKDLISSDSKVWFDPATVNMALDQVVTEAVKEPKTQVVKKPTPIPLLKAVKNEIELEGMRRAHARDGAACVSFFSWLEERVKAKDDSLTECSVADKLEACRAAMDRYVSLSFDTISGSGANGAIIHYKPEPETCAKIELDKMYLCDSGAQYLDGTTDITRTFHFGTPSDHEKRCNTRVLQGHIAVARAVFPKGTAGQQIDSFARQFLWADGLEYNHGTGHGVGAFLNVHEGPHGISPRARPDYKGGLVPGMTISNEPGYYENGAFGIRIESIVVVQESKTRHNFDGKTFCEFETITYVPIQRALMDLSLLSPPEVKWIDEYHAMCREVVAPLLTGEEHSAALEWLHRETEPLVV